VGRPRKAASRDAILSAAHDLFLRHGYERTSMDRVAEAARVSKPLVYRHFADKNELFLEALRLRSESLEGTRLAPSSHVNVRVRLRDAADDLFAALTRPEALAFKRTLASEAANQAERSQRYSDGVRQHVLDGVVRLLDREHLIGSLDVPDAERAAAHFIGLVQGPLYERVFLGCLSRPAKTDLDAQLDAAVDVFLRAYGAKRGNAAETPSTLAPTTAISPSKRITSRTRP
jgi:TetR/AcrR family transcriptional repressor of mexJK operon